MYNNTEWLHGHMVVIFVSHLSIQLFSHFETTCLPGAYMKISNLSMKDITEAYGFKRRMPAGVPRPAQ